MGEVYVGHDEKLGRKVALKAIRAEHRLDAESKARLLREARLLSQLAHPNICQVYEYIEGDEADVLVLELIQGERLSVLIEKGLDFRKKLTIAIELAETLVAVHGQGVVYRDFKPDNVMVDDTGHVKILDFGLSRSTTDQGDAPVNNVSGPVAALDVDIDDLTQTAPLPRAAEAGECDFEPFQTRIGSILGTLAYMSPSRPTGNLPPRRAISTLSASRSRSCSLAKPHRCERAAFPSGWNE